MPFRFGQFCPVALASEVLTPKWTLLVIRELNAGAARFNEIRRGVPRISPTLLKQRLDHLEHAGIVERRAAAPDGHEVYALTAAGCELKAVIAAVGTWGQRWAREIERDDLDPGWLVWAMHRRIDTASMPEGGTVIEIRFTDAAPGQRLFWFVCRRPEVEVCVKHPGFAVDLTATTDVRTLAEIWRGIRPLGAAVADGRLRLDGAPSLVRAFPKWLLLSVYAESARQRG